MNRKADILVIGAGPCGSFSALTAARLGAEVLVCEEHKEIGLPAHCAGHISISGLKRLGISLSNKVLENKIKGAIFYSPSGREFRVKMASPVTMVFNRELFDKYLAALAERSGARYMLGMRVKSLLSEARSPMEVSVNNSTLKSNMVIDAEGCSSILLKRAKLQTLDNSKVVNAIQAEVDNVADVDIDMVEVYLGQNYAPGLFAWIIPRRDGSAKVGLATSMGDPRDYLKNLFERNPIAREKLRGSKVQNLSYHSIPLGGPIGKTYYDRLLVVGDAASQVKPTTGGGVVMGLTCAKIAGETAHQAVQSNDFSEIFLARYQHRWRKTVGFDMAVMRQMRSMLNRMSDTALDKVVGLCSRLHLGGELQRVRDIDHQGRGVMPLFKNPAAWAIALYSVFLSLTSSTNPSVL